MGKMTKSELRRRKAELKQIVHAGIIKREVMQFRLESDNIERLYKIAVQKRKPVGTLVREWITERINAESVGRARRSVVADPTAAPLFFDRAIAKLRAELQGPLDRLISQMSIVEGLAEEIKQSRHR